MFSSFWYKPGVVWCGRPVKFITFWSRWASWVFWSSWAWQGLRRLSPPWNREYFNLKEMATEQIVYAHSRHFPSLQSCRTMNKEERRTFSQLVWKILWDHWMTQLGSHDPTWITYYSELWILCLFLLSIDNPSPSPGTPNWYEGAFSRRKNQRMERS